MHCLDGERKENQCSELSHEHCFFFFFFSRLCVLSRRGCLFFPFFLFFSNHLLHGQPLPNHVRPTILHRNSCTPKFNFKKGQRRRAALSPSLLFEIAPRPSQLPSFVLFVRIQRLHLVLDFVRRSIPTLHSCFPLPPFTCTLSPCGICRYGVLHDRLALAQICTGSPGASA